MAGTIVADIIQSDQSYASSINIASPMVVSNTLTMGSAASVSGNVNFDSGTLFVDSVNNRVGVRTTTPNATFQIVGDGSQQLEVKGAEADIWLNSTGPGTIWRILGSTGSNTHKFRIYDQTNNRDVLNIDASGRVTTPLQPMFNAWRTAGNIITNGTVIVWDSVQTNIGSCYNSSTGRFTAPVAGTYYMRMSGIAGQISGSGQMSGIVAIRKNGSDYKHIHWNHTNSWDNISGEVLLTLAVNDYVDFYVSGLSGSTSGVYGSSLYTSAMGYLVG